MRAAAPPERAGAVVLVHHRPESRVPTGRLDNETRRGSHLRLVHNPLDLAIGLALRGIAVAPVIEQPCGTTAMLRQMVHPWPDEPPASIERRVREQWAQLGELSVVGVAIFASDGSMFHLASGDGTAERSPRRWIDRPLPIFHDKRRRRRA